MAKITITIEDIDGGIECADSVEIHVDYGEHTFSVDEIKESKIDYIPKTQAEQVACSIHRLLIDGYNPSMTIRRA
jgi:hypothetical protein